MVLQRRYYFIIICIMQNEKEQEQEQELQIIEILFLEGAHFNKVREYFLGMVKHISLMAFTNHNEVIYQTKISQTIHGASQYLLRCMLNEGNELRLMEVRNEKNHQILYYLQGDNEQGGQKRCAFTLQLKSEMQIVNQQTKNRSIIRIIIKRYWQPPKKLLLFQKLMNMKNGRYIYKMNFCKFKSLHEMQYPSYRTINIDKMLDIQKKGNDVVLCLNQTNLRQLPFFVAAVEKIADHSKVSKIVGHPSSLFLTLLINSQGKCDETMKQAILRYKQGIKPQAVRLRVVTREQIVKGILFRAFSEQNLLNSNLIQFLIDNIVGAQFVDDFVKLIQLYYRIFLKQQIHKEEVENAIEHYFYHDQQHLQRHAYSFSSLFNFIQWRHNLECNRLMQTLTQITSGKLGKVQELTLLDLYRYNGVQFTFIGLDLTDKIVRFFNSTTTPNLPIVVLLALVQFLPTPYKSFFWLQQWGRYRIHNGKTVRQINITNHQIVDTRFLLQSPLDLIESQSIRNCYMKVGINEIVHAVSAARKKAEELPEMEQLKALLKSMKSKAIDAIPKLRLIWKILTTKNRIQLDLNNFQTFNQIPIISRFISLDETFKVYLDNFNKEANSHTTITSFATILIKSSLQIEQMLSNLNSIAALLSDFIKEDNLKERNGEELAVDVEKIIQQANKYLVKSYEQYLHIVNKVSIITRIYLLEGKYIYKAQLKRIFQKISQHSNYIDCQAVDAMIQQLLCSLRNAKIRIRTDRDSDVNSSSFMRDTYSPINGIQRVGEKLVAFLSDFKEQVRSFKNECHQKQPELMYLQYEKMTYRLCKGIQDALEKVSVEKKIIKFYSELYKYTPYLYQLQRMQIQQLIIKKQLKACLPDRDQSKVHLVLNGQPNTLLPLANQLIKMRNCLKDAKITKITSTSYHGTVAFLFSLGIDDETFTQQLLGLQQLYKVQVMSDEKMDLVELLLKRQEREEESEYQKELNNDLYLKIAKKYQKAFKVLIQLQQLSHSTKRLNIHRLYQLIDQYDKQNELVPSEFKQQEILLFLDELLVLQKKELGKAALVRENWQMIEEKMSVNKVGIKFMIRFLYRQAERETNWLSIHLQKYKTLRLYQHHLKSLFSKYYLPQDMTLQQFNMTNSMGIHLNFVLINYHRNRYEIFSTEQRGYVKLIDLLVATASSPVQCPTKLISIREVDKSQRISIILKKKLNKFTESFRDEAYWSNINCNSIPFNLILPQAQNDTYFCSFNFVPQTTNDHSANHRSLHQFDNKQVSEQKNNLRAIDLLSMWWTKSKKLTPELKEIIFGSIFDSPFLYYYYILQNSSYEALLQHNKTRNLMNLNQTPLQLHDKGWIIGHYFNNSTVQNAILKINIGKELEVEVVAIRANLQAKMEKVTQFMKQGQEYRFEHIEQLQITLYRFTDKQLEEYKISFPIRNYFDEVNYFEIVANDEIVISLLSMQDKNIKSKIIECKFVKNIYQLLHCVNCGRGDKNGQQGSTCSTCLRSDGKAKRGSLNMYLLAHESIKSDFQEFKCRVIEEVRQSMAQKKVVPQKNKFLCFSCCWQQPSEE